MAGIGLIRVAMTRPWELTITRGMGRVPGANISVGGLVRDLPIGLNSMGVVGCCDPQNQPAG